MVLTYVKEEGKKERYKAYKLQEKIKKEFEREKTKEKEAIRKDAETYRTKLPFKKKILGKPKIKLPKYSAERAIMKGLPDKARLVSEGETGYFKKEYEKESKWLSR